MVGVADLGYFHDLDQPLPHLLHFENQVRVTERPDSYQQSIVEGVGVNDRKDCPTFVTQLLTTGKEVYDGPVVAMSHQGRTIFAVISRVIKTFRVELPLRSLFDAPTVADMAVAITQSQAKAADPGDIERMLAELEALSGNEASEY